MACCTGGEGRHAHDDDDDDDDGSGDGHPGFRPKERFSGYLRESGFFARMVFNHQLLATALDEQPLGFFILVCVVLVLRLVGDMLLVLTRDVLFCGCCGCCPPRHQRLVDDDEQLGLSVYRVVYTIEGAEWVEAAGLAGWSAWAAPIVVGAKVLLWHLPEPVIYFIMLSGGWAQLSGWLRALSVLVGLREALYAGGVLAAAALYPQAFLAAPWVLEGKLDVRAYIVGAIQNVFGTDTFIAQALFMAVERRNEQGMQRTAVRVYYGVSWVVSALALAGLIEACVSTAPIGMAAAYALPTATLVFPIALSFYAVL